MADRRYKLINGEPQEAPVDGNSYVRKDGDWVLEGTTSGVVTSVFGRTGAVVAAVGDYSAFYAPLSHTHTESDITDGSLLARLADNETITGEWTHSSDLLIDTAEFHIYNGLGPTKPLFRVVDNAGPGFTIQGYDTVGNSDIDVFEFNSTNYTMRSEFAFIPASNSGVALIANSSSTHTGDVVRVNYWNAGDTNAWEVRNDGIATSYVGTRAANSTGTDYGQFSHDGTDFVADFANTGNWNVNLGSGRFKIVNGADNISLEHSGSAGRIRVTDDLHLGVGATGLTDLRHAGVTQARTQDYSAAGNVSGLSVRDHSNVYRDVGFGEDTFTTQNATLASSESAWLALTNRTINHTDSTGYTYTTPPSTATGITSGMWWQINTVGTGTTTLAPGSGVTLYWVGNGAGATGTRTLAQWSFVKLYRRTATVWYLVDLGNGGVT